MISFDLLSLPKVLLIGRRLCGINWEYAPCVIKNYELVFIYEGEVIFTIDDVINYLTEGVCILLKPGQIFSARLNPAGTCKYYIIHFNLPCKVVNTSRDAARMEIRQMISLRDYKEMSDVFELPQLDFKRIYLSPRLVLGENKELIFSRIEEALDDLNQLTISSQPLISCYLCQILIILSRITIENMDDGMNFHRNGQMPRAVKEAVFYIHDNYMKPFSLNDLCAVTKVSVQYLIRAFKNSLHKTPIQYINLFRISRAKDLLKYTSLSIKEISYAVGFETPYYFCRIFKKVTDMTPTVYRKNN
jgi:AraC-like DNA-binding protein